MSALNGTFEKKGWSNILELIPLCEKVKKLSALCQICSTNANFTFRTCAGLNNEMIGGADMYMPLCRECYQEKTKQQNLAIQILHSESQSTNMNDNSSDGIVTGDYLLNMEKLTITKSHTSYEERGNSNDIKESKAKMVYSHSPTHFKLENEDLRITGSCPKN